jgi:hypothetical protein
VSIPQRALLERLAATAIVLVAAGCGDQRSAPEVATTPFRFTDVTGASGLDFVTTSGRTPATQILEVKGGGLGLIDYDGDGDLDIFVPNGATMDDPENGPGSRLFENLGSMTFRDVTAKAGIALRRWAMGVTVGDYNGDGHDDLYVTCYGPNALLRNTGDGGFEDVTEVAGVGGMAGVGGAGWSTAAAFGDLDGDGDLDLYVVNYVAFDVDAPPEKSHFKGIEVFMGPTGIPPQHDVLYENLGDGSFRDITLASGCGAVRPSFGLGTVILDFTGDGRQDIFVGNDSMANFLFVNQGGLTFVDEGLRSGVASSGSGSGQATMGIALADVDGNGWPDLFTTNFANDVNTLHMNKDGRFFDDETRRFGLGMTSFPYLGWACGFYDLDHDADEDLLLFNGHVYPQATRATMVSDYRQPPLLFAREGPRFDRVTDVNAGPWLEATHCDRSAAFGDLDRDGDIDVVVGELGGPVRVLRNDGAGPGWLIVELAGNALGSRIKLSAGELKQTRWVYSGGSFLSSSARAAHFGLPDDVETVDIEVAWPDGTISRRSGVKVRQHLEIPHP